MSADDARSDTVLEVHDLTLDLVADTRQAKLIDGVALAVRPGRITALIGESGCGKTMTARAILGLLPPGVTIVSGSISYLGEELIGLSGRHRRRLVAGGIGAVSQDASNGLNPTMRIGDQIAETRRLHLGESRRIAWRSALELLDRVQVAGGERRLKSYPHELSGGMQQRVMIAMAIACSPRLLIADEPTTALDVTVQAEVLDLLRELCVSLGMGVLLVTHDLGVVAEVAHEVVTMYAGQVVERAHVLGVFSQPSHPYTRGLLASIPQVTSKGSRLTTLPGRVPSAGTMPAGCRFGPRCGSYESVTCDRPTVLTEVEVGHATRCTRVQNGSMEIDDALH